MCYFAATNGSLTSSRGTSFLMPTFKRRKWSMNPFACRVKRSSSPIRKAQGLQLFIAFLLLGAPHLFSQAAVGTILGGVFDSSGGAIAGAKVTIIDVARGTTRALTTDGAGEYTAPSLLSGTYTVRAEAN